MGDGHFKNESIKGASHILLGRAIVVAFLRLLTKTHNFWHVEGKMG